MRLRGVYLLLATAASVSAMLVLAGPAAAANLHCGEEIMSSVTLIGNLDCSATSDAALYIGADGVTLNLNGFAVTAPTGYDVIDNWANGDHGTTAGTPANGTTIKNGTLNLSGTAYGVDNVPGGPGGSSLTLDVVNIVGDGTSFPSWGVYSTGGSNTTVLDGSISGVSIGLFLESETADLVKNVTIAPSFGPGCFGVDVAFGTTTMIVGNAFSPFDPTSNPQSCQALFNSQSAGTQFTGNTVTGMFQGVESVQSAGLAVTSNVMDGNMFGVFLAASNSGDMIAGNFIKNSGASGIADLTSFNNTYTGNILTSNGKAGSSASYFIDPAGYGPVTMVNNYARLGYDAGFWVCAAYSDSVSGPPYSSFVGNNAIANGTDGAAGFVDGNCAVQAPSSASVGATWSANNAYANAGDGFLFVAPWREIVTGNTSKLNGDDGFLFYDVTADAQPLAVTNNSATYNGGYGFSGADDEGIPGSDAYPVAGSGNTGSGTNGTGDCYLVAGCS